MALSAGASAALNSADRGAIEAEFARIKQHWDFHRWLGVRNRYRVDTKNRIKNDLSSGGLRFPKHLTQYITASCILHAMDGWTFLGKAIASHLHGDCDTARHLAYYAELRAAMSLLASEGVGVFDRQHFVVGPDGKSNYVGACEGTHNFAWDALDLWAKGAKSATTIFALIRPNGVPLDEWLAAFSATPASNGLLAHTWIGTWGLDLQRMKDDRESRNLSSYRPTEFHFNGVEGVDTSLKYVSALWRLAEPKIAGFATLDAYLLRQALEKKFKAMGGKSSKQAHKAFRAQVHSMLHTISPVAVAGFDWEAFLLRESFRDEPVVLQEAAGTVEPGKKGHDLQVISRAVLLLRVASGSVSELLRAAGLLGRPVELDFWLSPLAERLGICSPGGLPPDRLDLWADIEYSLEEIERWIAGMPTSELNVFRMRREASANVQTLCSTEVAGVWALGI